jgi:hypothetical protein
MQLIDVLMILWCVAKLPELLRKQDYFSTISPGSSTFNSAHSGTRLSPPRRHGCLIGTPEIAQLIHARPDGE